MTEQAEDVQTMTIAEAMVRHRGLDQNYFMRRCIKGRKLLEEYGSRDKIPAIEISRAIFGKKVGKYWHVPVSELNRLFL